MLLYDRLMAHATQARKRLPRLFARRHPDAVAFEQAFAETTVFDLAGVLPLLGDWEESRRKELPRRPPFDLCWCEWPIDLDMVQYRTDDDRPGRPARADAFDSARMRVGAAVQYMDPGRAAEWALAEDILRECKRGDVLRGCHALVSISFRHLESASLRADWPAGQPRPMTHWQTPIADSWVTVTPFTGAGVVHPPIAVRLGPSFVKQRPDGADGSEWQGDGLFTPLAVQADRNFQLCAGASRPEMGLASSIFDPWPAVMAFTLMHCKNVVQETVTVAEDVQRRVRKSGNPPRVDYRVLKLTLPATHKARGERPEAEGEKPGVRFHLVRGHFKNLQADRYRNKGLHWWPSFARGTECLGEIIKDYAVKGA